MGQSFDVASHNKSAASYTNPHIYDELSNLHYQSYWQKDSLYIHEYRLLKKDTVHQRSEQVNYIIGSGQHTNSHLHLVNGYLTQMPMTFYTQKKKWDLPPGFENGDNTRFSRKIGLECMSCHNGYPEFVKGSENKYTKLPGGIDCERCHGPGSIHVEQRQSGVKVDTSKYIDYSIVNPAKLNVDAQFDICQRCHLQGNAILKEGKSFYDFKPGQKLSDYLSVFLPKYKNADDEFIMASHADRLKQSACFIKSLPNKLNSNKLKPYKDALTCVTCHNPHVSVKETNSDVFNDACKKCHSTMDDKKQKMLSACKRHTFNSTNCVGCHMPVSGSIDIPHVSVHDHYIRKPFTKKDKDKLKSFLGLYSINEKNPDYLTRAKAYINQYEKFEQETHYLDSATRILAGKKIEWENVSINIHLYFLKANYSEILNLVSRLGEQTCLEKLFNQPSYENSHAWTCYRIAESYLTAHQPSKSKIWFQQAVKLAPHNLEFRNKLGNTLVDNNDKAEAIKEFEFIIRENPEFVSAYSNLGYLKLSEGKESEALKLYKIAEKLDSDNEALLLNLAAYYLYVKNKFEAKKYLTRILVINPNNDKVKSILQQLN